MGNNCTNHKQNICWDCKNACGGCNWSRALKPVDGWDAELIEYIPWGTKSQTLHTTYYIKQCPEFVKDEPRKHTNGILSKDESKLFLEGKL